MTNQDKYNSKRRQFDCDKDQEDPHDDSENPSTVLSLMINPNTYDSKGRCVWHPQVCLRKKNLCGNGWKVLLIACPNCCVGELCWLQSVEKNNKKPRPERKERRPLISGNLDSHNQKSSTSDESFGLPVGLSFQNKTRFVI